MAHSIEALVKEYKEKGLDVGKLACVFFDIDCDGRRIEVWDVGSEHGRKFMNCHFIDDTLFYNSPLLRNLECACNRAARQLGGDADDFSWNPNELYECADCPWTRGDSLNPQVFYA